MRHFVAVRISGGFDILHLQMEKDIRLLVALRWAAIVFQICAVSLSHYLKIPVALGVLGVSIFLQIAVNLGTFFGSLRRRVSSESYIFAQLLFDFSALVVFVVYSGGLANPFSGLFLVQALLAALLLGRLKMWIMFVLTGAGYTTLLLAVPIDDHMHHQWMAFHAGGMVMNHLLTTGVIGWIVVRVVRNLKSRERMLSGRQGLVAAGAFSAQVAHKIATPLNVIALIADDIAVQNLSEDRERILNQVERVKKNLKLLFHRLTHIESQGPNRCHISTYFDEFATTVSMNHPELQFKWTAVNDRELTKAGCDLIVLLAEIFVENAAEAGAKQVLVEFYWQTDTLAMKVSNDGPPLSADFRELMLIGRTSKTEIPHFGIGLFLARLIIESISASAEVISPPGVEIKVEIPLEWVDG